MREARCDDTKHLKKGLLNNFGLPADHDYLGNFTFPLLEKTKLGYHNNRTARLLVPMTMSWDNEE
jgi:hypothetical protein